MTDLLTYLSQFGELTSDEQQIIQKNCSQKELLKGDYLLKSGEYCHQIAFVQEGILRTYFQDDLGNDVTKYFITKGHFAADLQSFNEKVISTYHIQAETDTRILLVNREALHLFSEQIDKWDLRMKKIIEIGLLEKASQKTDMLHQDATTRYLTFIKDFPNVANQVSLNHIASYLGITQFSLSRIRKNLSS